MHASSLSKLALVAGALAASAAVVLLTPRQVAADPPAASSQQCFHTSEVNGFRAPNDQTVYLRVGVSDIYRLDLMSNCPDVSFREGIGFEASPTRWVCSPLEATIVFREHGIPERCPVSAIHRLTPAEREALPKGDRP